jgi:CubicO group peptidase (beta-lactamase class C family)
MSAGIRAVTMDLLLSHHAGISPFTDTDDRDFKNLPRLTGTPTQRRAAFTAWVLRGKPAGPIGAKGLYSMIGGSRSPGSRVSLDDYARFLQINLRGLQGRDTPILKSATIKHLDTSPVSPPDNFALGWGVQDFEGAPASVHVGSAGAFYVVTIIQPSRDLGVAVFTNAGGERATDAAKEAVKALIRRYAKSGAAGEAPH